MKPCKHNWNLLTESEYKPSIKIVTEQCLECGVKRQTTYKYIHLESEKPPMLISKVQEIIKDENL